MGAPVFASAGGGEITIAYHLTHKCSAGSTGPGASPNNPIVLEDFDDAWSAAVRAGEETADTGKGEGLSEFECKWVKLSGYFRWSDYYDYRGYLYTSASAYYQRSKTSYIIESFADPATRRSAFQATQVELVGQFYDLCAYAPAADMVFGPCHYGANQGMMLSGVHILSASDRRFQILTGEANRPIIGDLKEAARNWNRRREVEASAREWLSLITDGRAAYERAIADDLAKMQKEERDRVFAPDGWLMTLLDPRSKITRLKGGVARLPLNIFYDADEEEDGMPAREVTACFCIDGNCRDRWPLLEADARRLADWFVCTPVRKSSGGPKDGAWSWRN